MSFFSSNMTPEEIDTALHNITKLYSQLSAKYGAMFFDYGGFRSRYLEALKNKNNMTTFFKVELELLQKKEQVAKDYKEAILSEDDEEYVEKESALDETINNIIAQTDSYPEFPMGERANIEIKRLVGMCRVLYPEIINVSIYVPLERGTLYHQCCKTIDGVVHEPYSFSFASYKEGVDNDFLPTAKLDVLGQKLIKELATALQTILSILRSTDPIKAGHIVEYISKALIDFRLDIFKGM